MNGAADPVILEEWASLLDAQARRIAQPSGMDTRLRRLWAGSLRPILPGRGELTELAEKGKAWKQ
jgi:hypothetical protein